MSNITSLTLTGAGGINRFEHSLGACFLALEHGIAWALPPDEARLLAISCLLHDVGSAAFGHSIQYVLGRKGYSHESLFELVTGTAPKSGAYEYQHSTLESIYFGSPRQLRKILAPSDLGSINATVRGEGDLGALVSGAMDFDNLDNVFRLAFHMGLANPGSTPLELAKSMSIVDGELIIHGDARPLVQHWYETRKRLYQVLLLNPDEFAGKVMLEEAATIAMQRSKYEFHWQDVDFAVIEKLYKACDETKNIITRLMLGDLYGCACILTVPEPQLHNRLVDNPENRHEVESAISKDLRDKHKSLRTANVIIQTISDIGRTCRQVAYRTPKGLGQTVGVSTNRTILGVFFRNAHLSARHLDRVDLIDSDVTRDIKTTIEQCLGLGTYDEIPLHASFR
jgi:HD superfamily phosphohydrolase